MKNEVVERYIFKQVRTDVGIEDLPDNLTITFEFDGDCHIEKVLSGFKDFLRGCSFSDSVVDQIHFGEEG